jgi:riboflavin synthase
MTDDGLLAFKNTRMFTGLITDVGTIDRVQSTDAGREFRIRTSYTDLTAGESIAVGGACLTVREFGDGWFTVAAVLTTLGRTTLGDWEAGRRVNLERALAAGDRLGGHMVQGHVDAVGEVIAVERLTDALLIDLTIPPSITPLVVLHGSVAVDGVSLTVNAIPNEHTIQLSLIDFTLKATTLGALRVGHRVQVEADIIGKYVQRLVAPHLAAAAE